MSDLQGYLNAILADPDFKTWEYCDNCKGIGADENLRFFCDECGGQGGRWGPTDLRVVALVHCASGASTSLREDLAATLAGVYG